jgi:serine/threonine protein kinase/WD40 repeat protein
MAQPEPPEIENIFDEIVMISDPEQRQSKLRERCAGNSQLLERVQSLLKAYSQGEFLESSAAELVTNANQSSSLCGKTLGEYCLLELLASGGMGEVYMAREIASTPSYVAVKVLSAELYTRHARTRFALEQELLRKLDHPGLARLIETGQTSDARPYFVMELVRGLPIDQFCDRAEMDLDKRLALVIQICQAMQHVHDLGIVHRDLKPSNILVQPQAGSAQVKIIDFGVAKCLGAQETVAASLTCAEQILGTPAYMSPEQLDWSADVSAQSDVYSIGAVLCKLLIGTTPLDAQLRSQAVDHNGDDETRWADVMDIQKLRQALLHGEPDRPSQILAELPISLAEDIARLRSIALPQLRQKLLPQLDWIVLKALSPQRSDRYSSVAALSADLQAVLEDRPTTAGPPSLVDRLSKWSKRNSHWLKNAAIGCLIVGSLLGFWWARVYRQGLEQQAASLASEQQIVQQKLQQRQFAAYLRQAATAMMAGNEESAERLLKNYTLGQAAQRFSSFALNYLLRQQVKPQLFDVDHQHYVSDMDISPDGRWVVTGDNGGEIRVHALDELGKSSLASVVVLENLGKEVHKVRFSPNGDYLAATGQDRKVRLWRTDSWKQHAVLPCGDITLNSLVWSPDNKRLAAGDRRGRLFVWELETLERQRDLPTLTGPLRAMAWSPDGKTVAIAEDTQVGLWNPDDWQCSGRIEWGAASILSLVFSPDSKTLAIGGYTMGVLMLDVDAGEIRQRLNSPLGDVWSMAFHKNDGLFVGYSTGYLSYFHRMGPEKRWRSTRDAAVIDTGSRIVRIAPDLDGRSLWIALHEERKIANLDCVSLIGFESLAKQPSRVIGAQALGIEAPSRGEEDISRDEGVALVQPVLPHGFEATPDCRPAYHAGPGLPSGAGLHSGAGPHSGAGLHTGKGPHWGAGMIALAGRDDQGSCILLYRESDGEVIDRIPSPNRVRQLGFSPDGSCLAIGGPDPMANASEGSRAATFIYHCDTRETQPIEWPNDGSECRFCFGESGKRLIVGGLRKLEIACIDSLSGELVKTQSLSTNLLAIHASRDGRQVIIGQTDRLTCFSSDLSRQLWSLPTPEMVTSIVDCPDDRTIACLSLDGRIRLWDSLTQEVLYEMPFEGPEWPYEPHLFWLESPDPNTLIFDGFQMPEAIRFTGTVPSAPAP